MKPSDCVTLQNQMKEDFSKMAKNPEYSVNLIQGSGFKELNINSDFMKIPVMPISNLTPFINSYLPTVEVNSQTLNQMNKFCSSLRLTKIDVLRKFQCIFSDGAGQGTWVGMFFKKVNQNQCQFYSNIISCSFSLIPDVYVIRESQSNSIGPFTNTQTQVYLVEKTRGLSKSDIDALFNVCSFVTNTKAITY